MLIGMLSISKKYAKRRWGNRNIRTLLRTYKNAKPNENAKSKQKGDETECE
jgi:hypothetical protein